MRASSDGSAKGAHSDLASQNPLFKREEAPPEPICPIELEYIWDWFGRLSGKRQNGMAVNSLTSAEILGWQERQRIRFEPWEEDVIDRIDALFVASQSKRPAS
jgi:hypothetical protein